MKGSEGDTLTFTVMYANKTWIDADEVYVKANIPSGLSLADANGGIVTNQEIKWNVGKLAKGTQGKLTFKLKVNDMNMGEDFATITARIGTDHKLTLVNTQDDTSLIKVMLYSNRYEHKHDRYIMGYLDGNVKPGRLITRAEIAAIFTRTLRLQNEVRHVQSSAILLQTTGVLNILKQLQRKRYLKVMRITHSSRINQLQEQSSRQQLPVISELQGS